MKGKLFSDRFSMMSNMAQNAVNDDKLVLAGELIALMQKELNELSGMLRLQQLRKMP